MVLNRFNDDDGVIDYQADGEHKTKKRNVLMEKPSAGKMMKVPMRETWHGEQRDESGAPSLEKDEDDDHDEHQRFKKRKNNS